MDLFKNEKSQNLLRIISIKAYGRKNKDTGLAQFESLQK